MGKRNKDRQPEFWIAADQIPQSPGHPFYRKLNELLEQTSFDAVVEDLCKQHYAEGGRLGIPPGVYFRMLLIGYFEGLDSQRAIAWRCCDSISLKDFLGYQPNEASPEHSSLTRIRQRLPQEVHEQVFQLALKLAEEKKLLHGKTLAVDSTTLEANAAMKSIVRKDTGEDYKQYLTKLAQEAGIVEPTAEELIRFDRKRQDKTTSNKDWESPTDPDARIAKMKDGATHLAYKAEHAVDLDSGLIVAAVVHPADAADSVTLLDTVMEAQGNILMTGSTTEVEEVTADKGYHKAETLSDLKDWNTRTYIPEIERADERTWEDKPEKWKEAFHDNRSRMNRDKGKELQKLRSEYVERTFAHVCETGGGRRSWLRGLANVTKRYLIQTAAHNLGVIMRKLYRVGTPRSLQGAFLCVFRLPRMVRRMLGTLSDGRSRIWTTFFAFADDTRNFHRLAA